MFKWIVLNRFYLTEECPLNIFVEIGLKINNIKNVYYFVKIY